VPRGDLHVSYFLIATEILHYATDASGEWVTEVVDDSSVAVDDSGVVHLTRSDNGLAYGNDSSGTWEWETLAENSEDDGYYAGGYAAMVVDPSGAPHITWFVNDLAASNGELWYATPNDP